jgi:hypothetical protein
LSGLLFRKAVVLLEIVSVPISLPRPNRRGIL